MRLLLFVLDYYINNEFDGLCRYLFPINNDKNPKNILEKEYWYLSDKERNEYITAFNLMVDNNSFTWDNSFVKQITNILSGGYCFTDQRVQIIANKIFESDWLVNKQGLKHFFWSSSDKGKAYENINKFVDDEYIVIETIRYRTFESGITRHVEEKNYSKIEEMLEATNRLEEKERQNIANGITKTLISSIKIDGEMTPPQWSCVHKITSFCKENGKSIERNDFFDILSKNNEQTKVFMERKNALDECYFSKAN